MLSFIQRERRGAIWSPSIRDADLAFLKGYYCEFRPCCVAQFVNDSFNRETVVSATIRRGCSPCGFVACFECESSPCPTCGGKLRGFLA